VVWSIIRKGDLYHVVVYITGYRYGGGIGIPDLKSGNRAATAIIQLVRQASRVLVLKRRMERKTGEVNCAVLSWTVKERSKTSRSRELRGASRDINESE
jgi:hypothetical protein